MQHTFASREGPVEVVLSKDGEAWMYQGHRVVLDQRQRLVVTHANGTTMLGHAAKVGDVWWVHVNGRTYRWERIEPGSSTADVGGGLIAPMPGKVLEVLVNQGQQQVLLKYLDEQRSSQGVAIHMDPPRVEVAIAANDPYKGPEGAAITIVEFSDFQ